MTLETMSGSIITAWRGICIWKQYRYYTRVRHMDILMSSARDVW